MWETFITTAVTNAFYKSVDKLADKVSEYASNKIGNYFKNKAGRYFKQFFKLGSAKKILPREEFQEALKGGKIPPSVRISLGEEDKANFSQLVDRRQIPGNLNFAAELIHFSLAIGYWDNCLYTLMIDELDKAIGINPGKKAFYQMRSQAKYFLGDMVGSKNDLDEAIRLDKTYPLSYFNRAVTCFSLEDHVQARSDYKKSLELANRLSDEWFLSYLENLREEMNKLGQDGGNVFFAFLEGDKPN